MAGNLFLQIEGLTGECAEAGHEGWIDVDSYSEGLQSASSASYGGGGGMGTVSYSDFRVTCKLEKAIPNLMAGCAAHKPYPKAKLHATKMGGDAWTYLEVTLTDVLITGVQMDGTENAMPHVSLTMAFSKIKTEYWEQSKTGGKGSSTNAEWDHKKNVKA